MAAAASIAVAVLLVQIYRQSTAAQLDRAQVVVAQACGAIRGRYDFYARGWDGANAAFDDPALLRDLRAVLIVALADTPGAVGGIWQAAGGPLVTVGRPVLDDTILASANRDANAQEQTIGRTIVAADRTVVLAACPLETPLPGLTAWAALFVRSSTGIDRLRLGLGLLLLLVLGMSVWLSWLIMLWSRHVGAIETALARPAGATISPLARTGERELDRIVDALNEAGRRLADGRRESEALAARVAASERLAALGRVAAGVAHEIRNPIASMQLKAENALAGDDARRQAALRGMLGQIARLDALVGELLSFTQKREARPRLVDLASFLAERAEEHAATNIAIATSSAVPQARLDPDLLSRVLDNLIRNACAHAGPDGRVTVTAARQAAGLVITVADTGQGIAPELRDSLFEPFVTGRPEGTGLGLAIAREFAEAQGGRLVLCHPGGAGAGDGAVFAVELPWLSS